MVLLIDNYDSFTYNLVQYLLQMGEDVRVYRNDEITIEDIHHLRPDHLLISPGPGNPSKAGISLEVIHRFHRLIPILGVCLGHQAIAQAFGGEIVKSLQPTHGKVSPIFHDGAGCFANLPNPLQVTRYHSLTVEPRTLPQCLTVSAETSTGEIMAIRHKLYPVEGVQFHPESIMTENGLKLLCNFFSRTLTGEIKNVIVRSN
ncbi:anthranilate synthase component II [Desulforamulus aeronauticus]|uniref:Para-aminobenzoate synthetase component 2 n=1 Tax=Desulforamulus aeronauticus DSM 10349 TaxID=1121421 RepID=A0A1M6S273_9FIRM|nr:aminodeoxychorismate/anthranilate synthase component II [Desulforamulus aeronauticus]SHK38776.1 para-aminobenzoate synthetase component 2 [Desulforamulus aeronauticus DSM 10349]